jgi:protein associated with RNAse G/E
MISKIPSVNHMFQTQDIKNIIYSTDLKVSQTNDRKRNKASEYKTNTDKYNFHDHNNFLYE